MASECSFYAYNNHIVLTKYLTIFSTSKINYQIKLFIKISFSISITELIMKLELYCKNFNGFYLFYWNVINLHGRHSGKFLILISLPYQPWNYFHTICYCYYYKK